ncbi:terminase [Agromyces aureus]|uniref:terminase n=1 Tax=Agromyces aureus TaxID=453304 RepID=UPI000AD948B0|nr:terminase [Agromyces aureus]
MARRRAAAKHDDSSEILRYYRDLLNEPDERPDYRYPPAHLGPTWETDDRGRFILPERSIGWASLVWAGQKLQLKRGVPWQFTAEQARMWLWWYAVDERGTFVFDREGVIQRLKGHGKDPWGAVYCANELVGLPVFDGFSKGETLATEQPDAWVQVLAVTLEQTKNTMRLFPRLFTDDAKAEYRLAIGKEHIYALGDERYLQALTSNPTALEGKRPTATLANETHHWRANNNGIDMYEALSRNAAKSAEGVNGRLLQLSNAYEPGMDSVLERTRLAYELAQARPDEILLQGLMYDSLEAGPEAPLIDPDNPDVINDVIESVRGDSTWLNVKRLRKQVEDPRIPPSQSRRFWYNQITANEESWADPFAVERQARPESKLEARDEIALFFDGSKSDDATAIVACRISDGQVFTMGLWQAPPKARRGTWTVPRGDVNQRVRQIFKAYRVVGFFADPSHTREDGTLDRYWAPLVDEWHRDFGGQLLVWPQNNKHSVSFDMSNRHGEGAKFVEAAELFVEDLENGDLFHDGNPELMRHMKNARRFPTQHGVSLMKDGPESPRKIDLAVCAVGARMVRRLILNLAAKRGPKGTVW